MRLCPDEWIATLLANPQDLAELDRLRTPVESVQPGTVWEQFLDVRYGRIPNPSPPEVGLRMAHLWDAIRASAAADGAVVRLSAVVGGAA